MVALHQVPKARWMVLPETNRSRIPALEVAHVSLKRELSAPKNFLACNGVDFMSLAGNGLQLFPNPAIYRKGFQEPTGVDSIMCITGLLSQTPCA